MRYRWLCQMFAVALALTLTVTACGRDGGLDKETRGFSGLLAASEFVVGTNRFPFGLVARDGEFLEGADVTVSFSQLEGEAAVFAGEAQAVWQTVEGVTPHEHPDGELHLHLDIKGVYVVEHVEFPHAGIWGADFRVSDRTPLEGTAFEVKEVSSAPNVGDPVPRTNNLTIHDVPSFADISTRQVERDDLHNISVRGAIDAEVPFVVFFASPQFCMSAMCGPVTDTLEVAHTELEGAVEFIHIEPWSLDAARERGRLVPTLAMAEWGLPGEPWTFVVAADGTVAARFEGLVTVPEVTEAVRELL